MRRATRYSIAAATVAMAVLVLFASGAAVGAADLGADGLDITAISATDDPVTAEDGGTYTAGTTLAFDVEHDGDGYQVRDDGNDLIRVETATNGQVIVDTEEMDPGTYTLEHGNSATVEYTFTLTEPTETPTPTATSTPDPDNEPLEHEIVWAADIPHDQRSAAVTTTGGLQWYGELLRIEVDSADPLIEVYDGDGNHVRTLVPHRGDAYLPTRDLTPGMYRINHEDDGRLFSVGVVRQEFDATVEQADGGDTTTDDNAVIVTSNRRGYDVVLASETIPAEYLADAFTDAAITSDVRVGDDAAAEAVLVEDLGRENRLAFDPDALPEGTHTLSLTVADAAIATTVEVTGTGPAITVEPTTEPPTEPNAENGENDENDEDTATESDGGGADEGDDVDISAPGFGPMVALLAIVGSALLAARRRQR